MTGDGRRLFAFAPGLRLGVRGDGAVRRHFDAEYGPVGAGDASSPAVELEIDFGGGMGSDPAVSGGHKSVRWRVELAPPETQGLRAAVELRGRPRSFGLSLVQGYYVEPLLAVAAARRGFVLLPAAAIGDGDEAVLIIGRSGSGKSSVCARALAVGREVLGDDHVLVDRRGWCHPFPRRMRFYSDLRWTAPRAYASLSPATRLALGGRGVVRRLTRGYVAPPVRVSPRRIGDAPLPPPRPLERIVVVERERGSHPAALEGLPLALERAMDSLSEQRIKLSAVQDAGWEHLLESTCRVEADVLAAAFEHVPVEVFAPARDAGAAESISALAALLAIEA